METADTVHQEAKVIKTRKNEIILHYAWNFRFTSGIQKYFIYNVSIFMYNGQAKHN